MPGQKRERKPPVFFGEDALKTTARLLSVRYLAKLPIAEPHSKEKKGKVGSKDNPLLLTKKKPPAAKAEGAPKPLAQEVDAHGQVVEYWDENHPDVVELTEEEPEATASVIRSLDEIQKLEVQRIADEATAMARAEEAERQRIARAAEAERQRKLAEEEAERRADENDRKRADELRAIVEVQRIESGKVVIDQDTRGQPSIVRSMKELMVLEEERIAQEQAAADDAAAREEAEAAEEQAREERADSSVIRSLDVLQQIEAERVAQEQAAAHPELLEVEIEPDTGGSIEEALGQAAERRGKAAGASDVDIPVYTDTSEGSMEISLSSISVMATLGLPWDEENTMYKLDRDELAECIRVGLDERMKWMLPVPDESTTEKGEKAILRHFADEKQITINGKRYYVFEGDGFANAKKAARKDQTLFLITEPGANYDYLGEVSGKHEIKSGEWPLNFRFYVMSSEELDARTSAMLPEGKPVWLYPVPEPAGQVDVEKSLMDACATTYKMTLGGKEYFVLHINDVLEWKNITMFYPRVRMASRRGEKLSIWPESENGAKLLLDENGMGMTFHGMPGPPLPVDESHVTPYDSELVELRKIFSDGKERWLCSLPQGLGDIDADRLNFLISVANRETELSGHTPLLSLEGRWYIALKLPPHDSKMAVLEGERVHINPKPKNILDEMKKALKEKRLDMEPPKFLLPADPSLRKPYLDLFPDGEARHLYYVNPAYRDYEPKAPHITLNIDGKNETFIVLKEPREGTTAVVRIKGEITFLPSKDN